MRAYIRGKLYSCLQRQTIGSHLQFLISVVLVTVSISLCLLYTWHERELRLIESEQAMHRSVALQSQLIDEWFRDRSDDLETITRLQTVRTGNLTGMLNDFQAGLASSKEFEGYAFVDQSGKTVVDTVAQPGTDVKNRDYFRLGMAGQSVITGILTGRATGRKIVILAKPVFDYQNEIRGIVFGTVTLQKLDGIIQNLEFGTTGKAYLVDEQGTVLAKSSPGDGQDISLAEDEGYRQAKTGISGAKRYINQAGRPVVGAYQWIPERNWGIIFEVEQAEVLAPLYDILIRALLGSLIILFLALCVARLIAKNIEKPIAMLFVALQRTQKGEYEHAVPEREFQFAPAEIRGLCNAFNIMLGTIHAHVKLLHNINEALSVAESKYRTLSIRDQLTQLYNRTYYEAELERLQALQQPVAVVVCDVDGLKLVNDTLGHKAGDGLIKTAARLLMDSFPPTATVARIGGDEFVVLLPNVTTESMRAQVLALYQRVDEHNHRQPGHPLFLSTGGVAAKPPFELEEMVSEADNYMYQEKERNRSRNRRWLLAAFMKTVAEYDDRYLEHLEGVKKWSQLLGRALKLDDLQMRQIELVAQYHDVGKIGVDRHILTKAEPLNEQEWEEIRLHPGIGGRLAKTVPDLQACAELIISHHERWDGEGYPNRLKGEEIPLVSRIVAIADAYDSMQRHTSYRRGRSPEAARQELENCSGSQFDPELVRIFLRAV